MPLEIYSYIVELPPVAPPEGKNGLGRLAGLLIFLSTDRTIPFQDSFPLPGWGQSNGEEARFLDGGG